MPRTILALILGVATLAVTATAAPKDKPTVKIGYLVCAKCTLGDDTGCRHAMKVTEGSEEVIYYVNDKGGRETYHRKICDAGNELKVKVTGTLVEKKGQKFIDYPKVEFIK